jgi:hypothetical protein
MMKRMVAFLVVSSFCMNSNLRAMDVYNAMSNAIVNFGTLLETPDNLPVIGKLTNLLPFGMLATACKQYPGQTMIVCAGLLYYVLSCKDSILQRLGFKQARNVANDDTLFIFDGDDEDDAEEQMEAEDELLNDDFDDWNKKDQQPPFVEIIKNKSEIKFI